MKARFQVIVKIKDEYLIGSLRKKKALNEWVEAYNNTEEAEEIQIYQSNGNTFELVAHETKRKIGFC